jgi:signal transduction histidine kinase/CheY-like chemotaxis protein
VVLNDLTENQRQRGEEAFWLHGFGPSLFVGHALSAGVLVWLLWDEPRVRQDLMLWFGAMLLVLCVRWLAYFRFIADPDRMRRGALWQYRFTLGAALSGLVWGYMGWHFFQTSLLFLFPMVLVLGTLVALLVPTAGTYFPAHAVFNLLTMTPFLARNLLEDNRLFLGQSFAIITLMVASLIFAYRQQTTIRESIRLRFANLDLLEQLKRDNALVDRARSQAEEANAAKSRFLASASHDLRQPLQALSLFIHALSDDVRAGRLSAPSLVKNIESSAESVQMLLDSLLDLSHAEAGMLKMDVCDVSLQHLFDRIRSEFSGQAAARGLRFRVVSTYWYARSDPAMLERMVRNLVVNALRYTESGRILIACRRRDRHLRIEVRDSGIGIAPEAFADIFRDFYQLNNPERDQRKGLGLGLSIVNTLARQLGHRIDVRSAPGCGSVFAIELPIGTRSDERKTNALVSSDRFRGRWLAVIDDDAQVRDAMTAILSRWGCLVICGENADEILSGFRVMGEDTPPAAILADWRLREGRLGSVEAQQLRACFGQEIPTLIITGDTTTGVAADAGFPVIHKPIHGFQLRARLDAILKAESRL